MIIFIGKECRAKLSHFPPGLDVKHFYNSFFRFSDISVLLRLFRLMAASSSQKIRKVPVSLV